jgi:hypothetical protein
MHRTDTWMQRKSLFLFGVVAVIAISVAAASAQISDDYSVNYFNTGATSASSGSGTVYIINTGFEGVGPSGNLCAMIYVYDPHQELKECCGCVVTPDQLLTISIASLTNNPANGTFTSTGAIKLLSASLNNTTPSPGDPFLQGCDPSGGGTPASPTGGTPVSPTPELRAWDTHAASNGTITEAEFEPSDLFSTTCESTRPRDHARIPSCLAGPSAPTTEIPTELNKLQADCAKVLNASGPGICKCPAPVVNP